MSERKRFEIHNGEAWCQAFGIEISTRHRDVSFWLGKRAVVLWYGRL